MRPKRQLAARCSTRTTTSALLSAGCTLWPSRSLRYAEWEPVSCAKSTPARPRRQSPRKCGGCSRTSARWMLQCTSYRSTATVCQLPITQHHTRTGRMCSRHQLFRDWHSLAKLRTRPTCGCRGIYQRSSAHRSLETLSTSHCSLASLSCAFGLSTMHNKQCIEFLAPFPCCVSKQNQTAEKPDFGDVLCKRAGLT